MTTHNPTRTALRRARTRTTSISVRLKSGARRAFRALPPSVRDYLLWLRYGRRIASQPDRQYLEQEITRSLAASGCANVLFVGCRRYTSHYPRLFADHGMTLFTCDVDPVAERFGSPGRHRTADVCALSPGDFATRFDAVVFSGVIGFGVDTVERVEAAARALATLLAPGRLLVCGSNTDRGVDPSTNPVWNQLFERTGRAGMTERVSFDRSTHVFDVLERRAVA